MLVFKLDAAAADNRFLYLVKFVIEMGFRVICKILMWSSDGLSVGDKRFGFLDLLRFISCCSWCLKFGSKSESSESAESDDVNDAAEEVSDEMVPGTQSYDIFGFFLLNVANVGKTIFDGMNEDFLALYLSCCGAT